MGTLLVTSDGGGNIHLHRVKLGPTQEQIDEIARVALEEMQRRGTPTRLELKAQALGVKLLNMAIPANIHNGDVAEIDGRVYQVTIKHGRNTDDLDERFATAQIETRAHEVLARGGGLVIQPDRVAPEVLKQFVNDFPAVSQILVGRAVEHFMEEQHASKSGLRRVLVSAQAIGHALVENHESLILALVGLGITIAIPPLGILGVPWEVEAALGGAAALIAHDAKGAVNDDVERRTRASVVREHLDIVVRAEAIQAFDKWAHGLGKKRVRTKPQRAAASQQRLVTQSSKVVIAQPLPVYAGAAPPRVMALA